MARRRERSHASLFAEDETLRADLMASRRHKLRSEKIGETFVIDVAWPEFGVSRDQALPVIYVMDANTVFGIAVQAGRFLQNAKEMPPALIVGVGYDLGETRPRSAYGALRTRDLTPSIDEGFLAKMTSDGVSRSEIEADPPMAGAEAFLDFLIGEVRPFIASLYMIDDADQTLVGSSLGGLFSLHALLTRPGAFQRHVANSPSLWWRNRELLEREARSANLTGRLFISVGALESGPDWEGVRDTMALARTMEERHPELALTFHVFEGETHTSVIPGALSRGLREVFGQRRLPTRIAKA